MKNNQETKRQVPEVLYNASVLRAGKGAKDWTIEQVAEEAALCGGTISTGTVQAILKGTATNPELKSLWALGLALEVPMAQVLCVNE